MLNDLENIKEEIKEFLSDCSSLVILGIGNDIRGDDGLGPYIISKLSDLKESHHESDQNPIVDMDKLYLIDGGSVPENFTGLIKKHDPSHIILIDASLMNRKAGEIAIVDKENISDISISTHSMSLSFLIRYLEREKEYKIQFIGIEPKIMDLSMELSEEIQLASNNLINIFSEILFE